MPSSALTVHQSALAQCELCENMVPPSVVGEPVMSPILLIGQAPGDKEPQLQRPFAWTAGKTLFKWFAQIGLDEAEFRKKVYMSAICRCFPGKNPKGGDRVPSKTEINTCSRWLNREFVLLQPKLVLPVGKLAISQYLDVDKLVEVIGQQFSVTLFDKPCDVIPLPHPSGASTWHRMEPGKSLLDDALRLIEQHRAWKSVVE